MSSDKSIAFTVCSNNYLGNALSFCQTFLEHNPSDRVCIVIVDRKNDSIDYYSIANGIELIFVEELNIPELSSMAKRYNIIELNTAIKPFAFMYLVNRFYESEYFYYFDPDILIFDKITSISNELSKCNAILTPHIITPIELDNGLPNENLFLNHGIYNLGFLGLRNTTESRKIIQWWSERLVENGFNDICKGMFTDQLYINYLPIFFEDIIVSRNRGLNVAVWNLHERKISFCEGRYFVNDEIPLIFFHYSGYDYKKPEQATKVKIRNTFINTPNLKDLYRIYQNKIIHNKIEFYRSIPCYYVNFRNEWLKKEKYKNCSIIKCILIFVKGSRLNVLFSKVKMRLSEWLK